MRKARQLWEMLKVTFHFWDGAGETKTMRKSYTRDSCGLVFFVDSVHVEGMEEAKTELQKRSRISENQEAPVLIIIANKI